MTPAEHRAILIGVMEAALAAADPAPRLAAHLPDPPKGRTVVVGAGKAAAAMAAGLEELWPDPLSGMVIVPYGYGLPTREIKVVEAGHPIPDGAGFKAAVALLALLDGLTEDDLVIALFSGGGSSLMSLPAPGLSLEDKRLVTGSLLKCGASIAEINCVRKHLSAVKGGRLAVAAWPARLHALLVSDVAGDDPSVIASGPTLPDPTTAQEALEVIRRHKLEIPFAVIQFLRKSAHETPKAGDHRLSRTSHAILLKPADMLEAAAAAAQASGFAPLILGDAIEGESREVAKAFAGMATSAARLGRPAAAPCLLLSGGETTVTVRGRGKGGPNGEFALSLALALAGHPDISAIAIDTDGMDGSLGAAGALVLPDSLARARARGIDGRRFLDHNDAAGWFGALGDLVVTGPTRTNLNDFRAILVARP